MTFHSMPTYSVAELERRAQSLLAESFGDDLPIPIDVEIVLEEVPGVTLDLWPGLRANHLTEGMVCRDTMSGELMVYIDEDLADDNPNRYRMTVAEELGHCILHRGVVDQVHSPKDFLELQRHALWPQLERNAKRFGAAVLMPGQAVLESAATLYPKLVAVAGFNNVDAILNQLAARLAGQFVVSPQTMGYRLNEWPIKVTEKVREAMREKLTFI